MFTYIGPILKRYCKYILDNYFGFMMYENILTKVNLDKYIHRHLTSSFTSRSDLALGGKSSSHLLVKTYSFLIYHGGG